MICPFSQQYEWSNGRMNTSYMEEAARTAELALLRQELFDMEQLFKLLIDEHQRLKDMLCMECRRRYSAEG